MPSNEGAGSPSAPSDANSPESVLERIIGATQMHEKCPGCGQATEPQDPSCAHCGRSLGASS
jgi:uncharacterized OB-fold protein